MKGGIVNINALELVSFINKELEYAKAHDLSGLDTLQRMIDFIQEKMNEYDKGMAHQYKEDL